MLFNVIYLKPQNKIQPRKTTRRKREGNIVLMNWESLPEHAKPLVTTLCVDLALGILEKNKKTKKTPLIIFEDYVEIPKKCPETIYIKEMA